MVYQGHYLPVLCLTVGKLGYYFASGGDEKFAFIWRTCDNSPVRMLNLHNSSVTAI